MTLHQTKGNRLTNILGFTARITFLIFRDNFPLWYFVTYALLLRAGVQTFAISVGLNVKRL